MKDKEEKCECCESKKCNCNKFSAGNSCIYGLGFIGAAIFFIEKASSFSDGVVGFLKALVWPVFMVYEVFKFLIN